MTGPRDRCLRCHKPTLTCVCARVPRVDNRTRVVVVQHPRERFHPIGTVRLLALGLANVHVDVAYLEVTPTRPSSLSERAALLYPAAEARELASLPREALPDELVVIDGTWHHVRALQRDLPWLRALPKVTLRPERPSRYRIRREPREECLSTVEAVVEALRELEPETPGFDALLGAFDSMIDDQVELMRTRRSGRRSRRPRSIVRSLPRALGERFKDLVVTYAETALTEGPAARGGRELVQLTALRVASGELFERVVRRDATPGLAHMRLSDGDVRAGASLEELRRAWRAFRRTTDLVAAWNQSTLDALVGAELEAQGLLLKAVYANAVARGPGALERVLGEEGLCPEPLPLRGRASERLANVAAVARLLHERALLASNAAAEPHA